MKRQVKWGVLGTAMIHADPLLSAVSSAPNAEVYAIAGRERVDPLFTANPNVTQDSITDSNGITYYDRYEELLNDPNVDIVYIRLPIDLYHEWTIKAAHHKKHVLCEKPVALNAQEAKQMIDVCRENKVIFMESFMSHFHSQHETVKEFIRDRLIGDVKMMRASFSYYLGRKEALAGLQPSLREGVVYTLAPYCVNSLRHIAGSEPTSVIAYGDTDQYGVDTTVSGILNYPNNLRAVFDCSFDMASRNEYEVIGTIGSIKVFFAYRPDMEGNGNLVVQTDTARFEITINDNQYVRAVEHISDCILSGTIPSSSGENMWNNMKVIDAVYQSLKNGSAVSKVQSAKREAHDWEAECGIAALFRR